MRHVGVNKSMQILPNADNHAMLQSLWVHEFEPTMQQLLLGLAQHLSQQLQHPQV